MTTAEPQLRPVGPEDLPFLSRLYAASRAAEMARSGWPDDAIAAFLAQQFELQHRYYQSHYADGEFLLVELDGQPVGRLYLYWCPPSPPPGRPPASCHSSAGSSSPRP